MFSKIDYKHQPKPLPLTKMQSSYSKLEKEMNKPPSDYEQIKNLVESHNELKQYSNVASKNVDKHIQILPHQKNNFKSKK